MEQLLHEAVLQSIRGMVPVKSILKEYLSDDTEEPASESQEAGAQEEEQETAPLVHEESIQAPPPAQPMPEETDVSGTQIPILEEIAPPPMPSQAEELKLDLSANMVPVSTVPTIIVDTEPPSVGFTHRDAVLDSENPERSVIQISNQTDDEERHEITHIEFDESTPPEAVDEFEDLEEKETLAVGADEFEML